MISVLVALCFGFSQLIEESTKSIIESKSIIEGFQKSQDSLCEKYDRTSEIKFSNGEVLKISVNSLTFRGDVYGATGTEINEMLAKQLPKYPEGIIDTFNSSDLILTYYSCFENKEVLIKGTNLKYKNLYYCIEELFKSKTELDSLLVEDFSVCF